jgi:hypothetical protein
VLALGPRWAYLLCGLMAGIGLGASVALAWIAWMVKRKRIVS